MDKIIVIGSGASGVHFAQSVLQKGYRVLMLDVGFYREEMVNPEDSLTDLKSNLNDPAAYFLGKDFEAVIYPDAEGEYYGFPPSKNFVFANLKEFRFKSRGFSPLFSFARGGLAEAWTAGSYPFNDEELEDFPFNYQDIEPYYNQVAERIGIIGEMDDLTRFFPVHQHILPPLKLDEHSRVLIESYQRKKDYLNNKLKSFIGRSRIAALSEDRNGRKGCTYTGRCIWGCPTGAFYTPSLTLKECMSNPNFQYLPGMFVSHFKVDSAGKLKSVVARSVAEHSTREFAAEKFVLAAGALPSTKIYLDTIYHHTGEIVTLKGLLDNRQILVPFLNLKMIGKAFNPQSYQYHQLAIGMETGEPKNYIHGQITTLKTAMIHPIIQNVPADLKTSIFLFRNVHAALGVINVIFPDFRREENYVTLEVDNRNGTSRLMINYVPPAGEKTMIKKTIKQIKKVLSALGCVVPPGMIHIRPMGASVHYAGTLPMCKTPRAHTTSPDGQSNDYENLYFVDGSTYPFLPAKNLTFTLMANAARVADTAF